MVSNPGAPSSPDRPSGGTAPSLPARPLRVKEATELSKSNDDISWVWPLWAWVTSDDILTNGLAVFSTATPVFLMGYDPETGRWADVARFNDVVLGEVDPIIGGFAALEDWIRDRYETRELMQFNLDIEFE